MPVTVKLSQRFYETFGHDIADELVGWFNIMDAAYRSDFKELFDANFGKLHAEMAQWRAELRQEMAQLETRLIRWMFIFWMGSIGTMIALSKFSPSP